MIRDAGPGTGRRAPLLWLLALATSLPAAPATAQTGGFADAPATTATPRARLAPPPAAARRGWTRVRVAKWALLGAATGFGVYALTHSSRADRGYDDLRSLCTSDPADCSLDGGRYVGPRAEALYRGSLREDRRAQIGILGGQVTLLGSVALFVFDLRNTRGPENIPYPAAGLERMSKPRGVVLGARVRF